MKVLVSHYQEVVKRKVDMCVALKEMCQKIYEAHSEALRFLIDNIDIRHPVLIKLASGIKVRCDKYEEEILKGIGRAGYYVQFKRRLPDTRSDSVHYEILEARGGIDVCLHVERNTVKGVRQAVQAKIGQGIDGFELINNNSVYGLRKRVILTGDGDTDCNNVQNAFRQLYRVCEPILREVEGLTTINPE